MSLIKWSSSLNVNICGVDQQHEHLVSLMNELDEARQAYVINKEDDRKKRILAGVLEELTDYTATHFTMEEELMAPHDYPGMEAHKTAHNMFTRTISEFNEKYKSGTVSLDNEIISFLKEWILNHIRTIDKATFEFYSKQ